MNFDDARVQAMQVAEKYKKEIERELDEQFVSSGVAAVMAYEVSTAIDRVRHYLQMGDLCTQSQFLRALEIILRNRAKSASEQMEIFSKLPDEPEEDDDKNA